MRRLHLFEFPARLAIIPHLVSREQMTDAVSLDSTMVYLFAITGPTAGGLTLAWFGVAAMYWVNVVSYLVAIAALLALRVPPIPAGKRAQVRFGALNARSISVPPSSEHHACCCQFTREISCTLGHRGLVSCWPQVAWVRWR